MRTRNDWQQELEDRGLGVFAPLVLQHWQPCLRLRLERAGDYNPLNDEVHDATEIGCSKLGGTPDAPPGFHWPTIEEAETGTEVALPFLAQIRLEEIAALDEENVLPHQGLLLFFFDFTFHHEQWQVLHLTEGLDQLQRQTKPAHLVDYGLLTPSRLRPERADSVSRLRLVGISSCV